MLSIRVVSETFLKVNSYNNMYDVVARLDVSTATQTILSKIPPNNSKLTYVWEQYLFHYVSEGGYIYLVMADDSAGRYVSR